MIESFNNTILISVSYNSGMNSLCIPLWELIVSISDASQAIATGEGANRPRGPFLPFTVRCLVGATWASVHMRRGGHLGCVSGLKSPSWPSVTQGRSRQSGHSVPRALGLRGPMEHSRVGSWVVVGGFSRI